jgi:hypothetical protein
MHELEWWRTVLREALRDAMRARRAEVVSVLRSTLGALDNAETASLGDAPAAQPGVIAGGVAGLGAGEVARRVVTPEEVEAVVRRELAELRAAALEREGLGRLSRVVVRAGLASAPRWAGPSLRTFWGSVHSAM